MSEHRSWIDHSVTPPSPPNLSEFLLARIAEDEAVLTRSEPFPHYSHGYDDVGTYSGTCPTCRQMIWGSHQRALAECEAKRRLLHMFPLLGSSYGAEVHKLLALPYAEHPDWREEWRP